MPRIFSALLILILLAAAAAGCAPTPTPQPTATPAPSATRPPNTPTPLPSATPLPSPTRTATVTPTPTVTPLPPLPAVLATPVLAPAAALAPASVSALRELARWGKGRAEQVEYSPDGRWLALRTALTTIVHPAQDLSSAQTFEGSLHFAPDSRSAVTLTSAGTVELWQVDGWKRLVTRSGLRAIYSPDGSQLAVVDAKAVQLLRAADGSPLASLPQTGVERGQFTRDGAAFITGVREAVTVWSAADGKALKTFEFSHVQRLQLAPDGSLLLVQGRTRQEDAVIQIYRSADWSLAGEIEASGSFVLLPDASRLYVYTNFPTQGRIQIFSLPDGQAAGEARAGGSVFRLAPAPDSKLIVASIVDFSPSNQQTYGYLKTFDAAGKELKRLDCGIICEPQIPVFSPDGRLLAVSGLASAGGSYQGAAFLFDVRSGERLRMLRGTRVIPGDVEKVAFSPDGASLAALTGAVDDALRTWKSADGSPLAVWDGSTETLNLGGLSPDGSQLAVYSDAGVSRLLQVKDGALVKQLDKSTAPVFGRTSDWVAATDWNAGKAEGVRLYKAGSGEVLTTFPKTQPGPLLFSPVEDSGVFFKDFSVQIVKLPSGSFAGSLTATGKPNVRLTVGAFSPDGKLLAAGSANGEIWLWNMADKKQRQILEGHKNQVSAMLFSKDGALLISASIDGAVLIWQASDGKLLQTIRSTELVRRFPETEEATFGQVAGLALSPDAALIAVSGFVNPLQPAPARAGSVLLVQIEDGALLRILPGGGGAAAFSPDGKLLFTSGDGAVHQWGVLP